MARMQDEKTHSFPDSARDPFDDLVGDLAMRLVAPPDEHIGVGQPGF